MFEDEEIRASPWSVAELEGLVTELATNVLPEAEAAACLAQVEVLEVMKSAICAAQVRATQVFVQLETGRLEELAAGARESGGPRLPRSASVVGSELGLARQESPSRGQALARAATALVTDLPRTLEALSRGVLNEERALMIVRETEDLPAADRRAVDQELHTPAGPPEGLGADGEGEWPEGDGTAGVGGIGTEALRRLVQRLALRHDSTAVSRRMERARARRRVTGRLLSDGTGRISAVVKAEHYAQVMAALSKATASARREGDPRTGDQVRADTLVQRLTGLDPVAPVAVELNLVLPATSLLGAPGAAAEPGWVRGGGFLPAGVCRDLFTGAAEAGLAAVRRVFADPDDGRLVAMETKSRTFVGPLAQMIRIRDGDTCRTPWCDAPIRHLDHVIPDDEGGPTSFVNGQGLCEGCNLVKETPGWSQWVGVEGRNHLTTPTGSTWTSRHTPLAC